jgi:putative membrane protein
MCRPDRHPSRAVDENRDGQISLGSSHERQWMPRSEPLIEHGAAFNIRSAGSSRSVTSEPPPTEPARSPSSENPVAPAAGQPASAPPAGQPQQTPVTAPRTRTSTAFSGFVAGAIVLILLLIFILENTQSVKVSYFGASGHVALGVALLLAAVGGALLVGILGAARIAQVRRHAKRHQRAGRP